MELETLVICILSSTVAAAVVNAVKDIFLARSKRKDDIEDREDDDHKKLMQYIEKQEQTDQRVNELIEEVHKYMLDNGELMQNIIKSNKLIMLDRIKHIALGYIRAGKISYEDRKLLHNMWDEYHNAWNGNGDLNLIMSDVDELPLDVD